MTERTTKEHMAAFEGEFVNSATLKAVIEAGNAALNIRGNGLDATIKSSKEDIVTQGDMEVSSYVTQRLKDIFPQIEVVDEERDVDANFDYYREGITAVLDPIDGTTNYYSGDENWGVSVGFIRNGETYGGIIYQPQTRQLYYAEKEKGAYKNNQKITVSTGSELKGAVPYFDYPYPKDKKEYEETEMMIALISKTTGTETIRLGSQVIELMRIAEGKGDFFFHLKTKPWDMAAAISIVQEAGGVISNIHGATYRLFEENALISNGKIDLSWLHNAATHLR